MLDRRDFIRKAALGTGALVFAKYVPSSFAAQKSVAESRIDVLLNEPLGKISPNIYGHFTEDLSGVIYDGVWVGENSKVPNIGGIRKKLVEQMRKIHPPVVRFPGGCFADSYDWRDGIGPADKRPQRTNFWAGGESAQAPADHKYDPNQFGTDEFVHFCRLIGAQPYLAANVRSLPALQFDHWVEYCNSPEGSTTLARMRAAAGYPKPFDVRYWGVGNESWGCGGNFTPQEYAEEYRRFTTWVPSYHVPLHFIASGPNSGDWAWTRGFLEAMVRKNPSLLRSIYGLSLHYYAWNLSRGRMENWYLGKGDALKFGPVDWYELLRQGDRMQSLIDGHWEIMGEFDREHHIKLVVDEWGPWYKPGSALTPGDQLEQMITLRDAVFSGMTLDIFNRNPEKVGLAACAQLINCLNSLYLAHDNQFCVTPVGHIFEMYAAHQGGQSLRTIFLSPQVHYDRDGKPATFWGLKGSASLHGKDLVLTVVNPDISKPRETAIGVRGAAIRSGTATVLTAPDIHAHNTFEHPNAVVPTMKDVANRGGSLTWTFPPASVTKLTLTLA
jgi:alpha-N-arabinofuranosidase